ncbi:hypothetical protein KR074_005892 [Drosophila pseudoananassae]|nr:hypothetical protein KR074_005892 [Drosophila pseudoananassae]
MDIFESFCRTCGNECLEPLNIFEESTKTMDKLVPIAELMSTCLPANLPPLDFADDYPKQICRICLKKLALAYEFHHQWLGAYSEFNVALKFEQRRKRSIANKTQKSKPDETPQVSVEHVEEAPPEQSDPDWMGSPTEEAPAQEKEVKSKSGMDKQSLAPRHRCTVCNERFLTEKACRFHHKFSHKAQE